MREILRVGIFPCTGGRSIVSTRSRRRGGKKKKKKKGKLTEDTSEIELDLESNVDVGTINRWAPPKREAPVGDLRETGTLSIREFLEFHRLLESRRLLPNCVPERVSTDLETTRTMETHRDPPRWGSRYP